MILQGTSYEELKALILYHVFFFIAFFDSELVKQFEKWKIYKL